MHTHTHLHLQTYTHVHYIIQICIYINIYIHIHIIIHICIRIYICMQQVSLVDAEQHGSKLGAIAVKRADKSPLSAYNVSDFSEHYSDSQVVLREGGRVERGRERGRGRGRGRGRKEKGRDMNL
jgi:hypothetical protein